MSGTRSTGLPRSVRRRPRSRRPWTASASGAMWGAITRIRLEATDCSRRWLSRAQTLLVSAPSPACFWLNGSGLSLACLRFRSDKAMLSPRVVGNATHLRRTPSGTLSTVCARALTRESPGLPCGQGLPGRGLLSPLPGWQRSPCHAHPRLCPGAGGSSAGSGRPLQTTRYADDAAGAADLAALVSVLIRSTHHRATRARH